MRVVVAALERDCVAHLALEAEGIPHSERVCEGVTGYAALLADAWREGGFVLLEHDVVPWVGAVQQLVDCERDWCAFPHAKSGTTLRALGLVKFSDGFVDDHPGLAEGWRGTSWTDLDGVVLSAVDRLAPVCEHGPAVGHARAD